MGELAANRIWFAPFSFAKNGSKLAEGEAKGREAKGGKEKRRGRSEKRREGRRGEDKSWGYKGGEDRRSKSSRPTFRWSDAAASCALCEAYGLTATSAVPWWRPKRPGRGEALWGRFVWKFLSEARDGRRVHGRTVQTKSNCCDEIMSSPSPLAKFLFSLLGPPSLF